MATTETMTIHKALCELKIMDDRIRRNIEGDIGIIAYKKSAKKVFGKTPEEMKAAIMAADAKTEDSIRRRNAIKRAVVLSNATTIVKIGGQEYTVAEAIEMKNHGIEYDQMVLSKLKRALAEAKIAVNNASGDAIERRAEQYVLSIIAAQPKDSKMAADSVAMKELKKQYIDDNEYVMIDPLHIEDRITEMQDYIDNFMSEVDSTLSVSNAVTEIQVTY